MRPARALWCALAVPWLTGSAPASDWSARDEARARKLYLTKCARCHQFHSPANYSAAEWQEWMRKMSRKAKLKPDQDRQIRQYLDAWRSDPKKPPP